MYSVHCQCGNSNVHETPHTAGFIRIYGPQTVSGFSKGEEILITMSLNC